MYNGVPRDQWFGDIGYATCAHGKTQSSKSGGMSRCMQKYLMVYTTFKKNKRLPTCRSTICAVSTLLVPFIPRESISNE